jgi:hypothetical protein
MNSVGVWSVLECFRNCSAKVSLANDYIPRWVSLVDSPCVNRNSLDEIAQFLLLLQFGAFSFRLFGLKGPDGFGRDPRCRCLGPLSFPGGLPCRSY